MSEKYKNHIDAKHLESMIDDFLAGFNVKKKNQETPKPEELQPLAPLQARIQYFFHVLEDYQDDECGPEDILNHFLDVFDDVIYYDDEACDDCDTTE